MVCIGRYKPVSALTETVSRWDIGFGIVSVCVAKISAVTAVMFKISAHDRNKKRKGNQRVGMHAIQTKRKKKINNIIHCCREKKIEIEGWG